MKTFDDATTYLTALQDQPKLAIIPISFAAEIFNRTPRTIKNWLRDGKLKGISIAGEQFVRARSLYQMIEERNETVLAVKKRLIEMLVEGRNHVFYAEIMQEFGYDYKLSPDRDEFGWILGYVSRSSHIEMEKELGKGQGGLLSSMVWRKDLDFVGPGYWGLVTSLGYEEPDDDDAEEFVSAHIQRCVEYYT
ncbi:hypothetical protein [Thioclava sp. GXIMD4215]|uniref:hypothetical protein n=1 Tax=Thioclava sp. GXIMD4215 TaxID=3131928 RepID=UPI00311B1BE3